MAKVSVYNIEGKEVDTIELNDAVFGVEVNEHLVHMAVVNQLANRKPRHVLKFPVAEENHGDRKEQVTQDRDQQDHHSGQAVELYSLQFRETIPSK
jgi:ribosomal protein L4